MPISWTADLDTGIPLIDQQHRRIVDFINHLEVAKNAGDKEAVKQIVYDCADYTLSYFAFEESLQEEAGYPVSEYPGLLRWQDGITLRRPLWRKVRKLYLNPRAFFRDMFNPRSR